MKTWQQHYFCPAVAWHDMAHEGKLSDLYFMQQCSTANLYHLFKCKPQIFSSHRRTTTTLELTVTMGICPMDITDINLRLSLQCHWKVKPPGMWCCIIEQRVPDVLNNHTAFMIMANLIKLLDLEDKGTTVLWNVGNYSLNATASHPRWPISSETTACG